MRRRDFLATVGLLSAAARAEPPCRRREALANEYVVVYASPDAQRVYAYSPGLARLPSGRLVATMDQGFSRDGKTLEQAGGIPADRSNWWGKVFVSDNHGRSWRQVTDMPMRHARPFVAGRSLYVLGHSDDLVIMRSDDEGESWSDPVLLTQGQKWHQAPCNVLHRGDRVYLVMERVTDPAFQGWTVSVLAPVVMSAKVTGDLTRRAAWVFSSELSFRDALSQAGRPSLVGVPFFAVGPTGGERSRTMQPIGWLETNIVQFLDPRHIWHDPTGRTYHLWMRAHTGSTNLACIAKAVESGDGAGIRVSVEKVPSGEPVLYVPCLGGHLKFHILWDEQTRLFWLLSSQATDSMTAPQKLPADRYGLPNNERHRLALHFSSNCMDWCFAGLVADSGHPRQGRHYASMVIDGDDLHVLSRSGDARAKSAHDANLITFHTVKGFRELAY